MKEIPPLTTTIAATLFILIAATLFILIIGLLVPRFRWYPCIIYNDVSGVKSIPLKDIDSLDLSDITWAAGECNDAYIQKEIRFYNQ